MNATSAGLHVPGVAVTTWPTFSSPVIVGSAVFTTGMSLKWMNPLGQPLPERVILAHEKSPPQLSWDTMISSADTTCSTYATCPADPAGRTFWSHQAIAPTAGVAFVMREFELPQYMALPDPVQGRVFGIPLLTMRYAA